MRIAKLKHNYFRFLLSFVVLTIFGRSTAQNPLPEDFVTASILVADPGEGISSHTGHAFFRMQCPQHKLDYCFSNETEPFTENYFKFLSGSLRYGMRAIPTSKYLENFVNENRSVYQYDLNLPIAVKQNLWRVLDNELTKGMERPSDYLERSCAISTYHLLQDALGSEQIDFGAWPPEIDTKNRREILFSEYDDAPWQKCILGIFMNGAAYEMTENSKKLITPKVMVARLQQSRAFGRQLLSSNGQQVVKGGRQSSGCWFTPFMLGIILVVLTPVFAFMGWKFWDYALLALQSAIGFLSVYLLFISSQSCYHWSWLVIPFNPLPLLLWKWRTRWQVLFAAVLVIWVLGVCLSTHALVGPELVLLTVALIENYLLNRYIQLKKNNNKI